jgi:uncharacterized protein
MFERKELQILLQRLQEQRHFIQVLVGPRQVGKTTLVRQLIPKLGVPVYFYAADDTAAADRSWLKSIWANARLQWQSSGATEGVLIIDEIQKIPNWSEVVKAEWDSDTFQSLPLKVVLLGSARLRIQEGLSESLAGRFELIPMLQWDLWEMQEAFGYTSEDYVWFGGYPGGAILRNDERRWRDYMKDSIIETTISRDILMLSRVEKPALLRRVFELGAMHSGQILSYTKVLGQLQDSGNMATMAHYHELLDTAGLLGSFANFHQHESRVRASQPKWQVYDASLLSVLSGLRFMEVRQNAERWGQWVENAVGAYILRAVARRDGKAWYWRDRDQEVDFVLEIEGKRIGLEVKSNAAGVTKGMNSFDELYRPDQMLLIGDRGLPWETFLKMEMKDLILKSA